MVELAPATHEPNHGRQGVTGDHAAIDGQASDEGFCEPLRKAKRRRLWGKQSAG